MNRELKFRAWNENLKAMQFFNNWCPELEEPRMQFTGLKDKNGKEIYEGDIIRCYDTAGEVVYEQEVKIPRIYEEIWGNREDAKCEIIGNIYENPELLKAP